MIRSLYAVGILLAVILLSPDLNAQTRWEWVKGEGYDKQMPIWGAYNQAHPSAQPGHRREAATWVYNGELYLFGGRDHTKTPTSTPTVFLRSGYNDVWKFSPSINQWTLLKGPKMEDDTGHIAVIGAEHPDNVPSARQYISYWHIDSFLYVYSGDMWRYNMVSNNWMCISTGPVNANGPVYGTQQGIPSPAIFPGIRTNASCWVNGDKLYLFGGRSPDQFSDIPHNDVWRYDLNTHQWEWMKGGIGVNGNESLSPIAIEHPNNRPKAKGWPIHAVYGDQVYIYGEHNEVWRYNMQTNNWAVLKKWPYDPYGALHVHYRNTAKYGQQGVFNGTNTPGDRQGAIGWNENGKFYLFGGHSGYTYAGTNWNKNYGEIWEFDTALLQWRYIKGTTYSNNYARFGEKHMEFPNNNPGGRARMLSWHSGNNVYIANGIGMSSNSHTGSGNMTMAQGPLSDVWRFNRVTNNWSWVHGTLNANLKYVRHDAQNEHLENRPEFPNGNAFFWSNDTNLYVYGTSDGKVFSRFQDSFSAYNTNLGRSSKDAVWQYNSITNIWSVIKENTSDSSAVDPYAVAQGVFDPMNTPGVRSNGVTWTAGNKLYLFGGWKNEHIPHLGNSYDSLKNDLWEFDLGINQWRRLKGDVIYNVAGVYGTLGQPAATNQPGSRKFATTWSAGNKLYLFGGWGIAANGQYGPLNDLWEFDLATNDWTWKGGTNAIYQQSIPGTLGVPNASNRPGARSRAYSWTLGNKLYMFAGIGRSPQSAFTNEDYLHELWMYDLTTNHWTLLKGVFPSNNSISYSGSNTAIYGVKGVESPTNRAPSSIGGATAVSNGKLLLYGGYGAGACGSCGGSKDNLWSYNPQTNAWTWLEGNADNYISHQHYPENPVTPIEPIMPTSYMGLGSNAKAWAFNDQFYILNQSTQRDARYGIWRYALCDESAVGCNNTTTTPPFVHLGNDTTICDPLPLLLNAGNLGYKYLWSTNDTTQTIIAIQSGQYWVRVTDPNNSTVFTNDTIHIQYAATPTVPFAGSIVLCGGDVHNLNAQNPGASYLWNTNSTQQSILVDTTGTYQVTITDNNGCSTNASIDVTWHPKPFFTLGPDTGYCNWTGQDSFYINPQAAWSLPIGCTYLWNDNSTEEFSYAKQTGDHSLTVTSMYGCTFADTAHITLDTVIPVVIGPDSVICDGGSLVLSAYHPGFVSYYWLYGGVTTPTLTVTIPNNYICGGTTQFGCGSSGNIIVTAQNATPFSLGNDTALCNNSDSITLDAYHPNATYVWSTGSLDSSITVTQAGTYNCVMTNEFGCTSNSQITINSDTAVLFSLGNDTAICSNTGVTLSAPTQPGYTYLWSTGSTNAAINVIQPGIYSCELYSPYGCSSNSSVDIGHLPVLLPISDGIQTQLNGNTLNVSVANVQHCDSLKWEFGDGNTNNMNNAVNIYAQNGTYTLRLNLYNQCFHEILEQVIVVGDTTNTIKYIEMEANGISVYPNPASAELNIRSLHEGVKVIRIVNLLGQETLRTEYGNKTFSITQKTGSLPDGAYVLIVETDKNRYATRIVKIGRQ